MNGCPNFTCRSALVLRSHIMSLICIVLIFLGCIEDRTLSLVLKASSLDGVMHVQRTCGTDRLPDDLRFGTDF